MTQQDPNIHAAWQLAMACYRELDNVLALADRIEDLGDTALALWDDLGGPAHLSDLHAEPEPPVEPPCNPEVCRMPDGRTLAAHAEDMARWQARVAELEAQLVLARMGVTGRTEQ